MHSGGRVLGWADCLGLPLPPCSCIGKGLTQLTHAPASTNLCQVIVHTDAHYMSPFAKDDWAWTVEHLAWRLVTLWCGSGSVRQLCNALAVRRKRTGKGNPKQSAEHPAP